MSLPTETNHLVRNESAAEFQEQGLVASLSGDQPTARQHYAEALQLLAADGTADTAAQRAAVFRDDAFTYAREGVANSSTEMFTAANAGLHYALGETALLVSGAQKPEFKQVGPHQTHKQQRRELFSTHAATLGLLARTATAEEVTIGSTPETTQQRATYGFAHDYARLGTNGYIRVSNAMNGARDERIQGRLPHTAVWLARAAFGVVWSVKNDRDNLTAAARTLVSRLGGVRTAKAARQSITVRP